MENLPIHNTQVYQQHQRLTERVTKWAQQEMRLGGDRNLKPITETGDVFHPALDADIAAFKYPIIVRNEKTNKDVVVIDLREMMTNRGELKSSPDIPRAISYGLYELEWVNNPDYFNVLSKMSSWIFAEWACQPLIRLYGLSDYDIYICKAVFGIYYLRMQLGINWPERNIEPYINRFLVDTMGIPTTIIAPAMEHIDWSDFISEIGGQHAMGRLEVAAEAIVKLTQDPNIELNGASLSVTLARGAIITAHAGEYAMAMLQHPPILYANVAYALTSSVALKKSSLGRVVATAARRYSKNGMSIGTFQRIATDLVTPSRK